MIRRKLTLKRVDPWSVLKFGFVVNVALLLVGLLAFWILWITIRRLGLIEQFCGSVGTIVLDLQECSVNGGNVFRTVLFLGVLGVVVQTGIAVFGAFLYNLIADLTGGLAFSFLDESGDAVLTSAKSARADDASPRPAARSSTGGGSSGGTSVGSAASGAAAGATAAGARSSGPSHDTGSFRPSGPPRTGEGSGPSSSASSSPGPRSAADPTGRGSASDDGSESSERRLRGDDEGDGDHGRERSSRPSGSSLWGDPTRSRE